MLDEKNVADLDFDRLLALLSGYAATETGRRRIAALVPLESIEALREALEAVEEAWGYLASGREEHPPDFAPLGDPMRLAAAGSVLDGGGLNRVGGALECARRVRESVSGAREACPLLWERIRGLRPAPPLERRIRRSIDANGEVLDAASPRLSRLRKRAVAVRGQVLELLGEVRTRLGSEVDSRDGGVTLRAGRYVIPVRAGSRAGLAGIVHDRSRSGGTRFIEPREAIEPNNRIREVELEIHEEIEAILGGLTAEVRGFSEALKENEEILGWFDSVRARARFAAEFRCAIPEVSDAGPLRLVGARHPLLARGGEHEVVPLDLELEPEERSVLISGPNAGGKTVLLKTVGLLTLMAHCGIPPPLEAGSRIPFVTSIYTDIGDDQSIENDLSTFSSKMTILRGILEKAGRDSLVLLDEIGSGTDPTEGQALAFSVVEALTERGSLNFFTTHFGALKGIAGERAGVVNGSLGFDADRIGPTFRFRKGTPGRSYGLEIAERLGLDPVLLERARARVPAVHRALDDLVAELEEKQADLRAREVDVARRERLIAAEEAEWERERETTERALSEARQRAEAEIRQRILDTRKRLEAVIEGIQDRGAADAASIREARRSVERELATSRARTKAVVPVPPAAEGAGPLRPGDGVYVDSLRSEGVVLDVGKGGCTVRVGRLRVMLPREALRVTRPGAGSMEPGETPETISVPPGSEAGPDGLGEIDIRGVYADEVMDHVQRAIDTALVQGVDRIRIIHGKGKGVLRKKVEEVLRGEVRVRAFRPGGYGEGGAGVTIAEID